MRLSLRQVAAWDYAENGGGEVKKVLWFGWAGELCVTRFKSVLRTTACRYAFADTLILAHPLIITHNNTH